MDKKIPDLTNKGVKRGDDNTKLVWHFKMTENHINDNSSFYLDIDHIYICKSTSNQVSGLVHLRNFLDQKEISVFC